MALYSIMQNAVCPTSEVLWTVLAQLKSPTLTLDPRQSLMKLKKKKGKLHISSIQCRGTHITIPKGRSAGLVRKHLSTARTKSSRANPKYWSFTCDVKGLRWLHSSTFAAWNTLLCPWLGLLPECNSSWRMSHGSSFFNTLESPVQPRLHFHSFTKWSFKASMKGLSATALALESPLNCGRRLYKLCTCVSFLTLKLEPHGQHWRVHLSAWNGV